MSQRKLYRFQTNRAAFGVITEHERVVRAAPYAKAKPGEHIDSVRTRFRGAFVSTHPIIPDDAQKRATRTGDTENGYVDENHARDMAECSLFFLRQMIKDGRHTDSARGRTLAIETYRLMHMHARDAGMTVSAQTVWAKAANASDRIREVERMINAINETERAA